MNEYFPGGACRTGCEAPGPIFVSPTIMKRGPFGSSYGPMKAFCRHWPKTVHAYGRSYCTCYNSHRLVELG